MVRIVRHALRKDIGSGLDGIDAISIASRDGEPSHGSRDRDLDRSGLAAGAETSRADPDEHEKTAYGHIYHF